MVSHPSDYPWSSYAFNALGKGNVLLTPHSLYLALGSDAMKRQDVYRALFEHYVPESTFKEIRDATNKAWVLGGGRFQEEVEQLLERQAKPKPKPKPKPRGGDRRSEKARKQATKRVSPNESDLFVLDNYPRLTNIPIMLIIKQLPLPPAKKIVGCNQRIESEY